MLTSLFGDLDPLKKPVGDSREQGFAATAIMETVSSQVNDHGQMVDRHSRDLVVTGSPAQAIRQHFADTRADLETATSLITMLDPAGVWASAVIKALSDAGGRPVERLHLREHATLRTLATIERTSLVRRQEETLRIYHADVRAPGSENAEIPVALMERSQMSTVIIGPLQPHAIDALLAALLQATMLPTWRCPNLLFMLPPNAVWIATKIGVIAWPGRLHVHVLSESMTGASSVWNAMLGMWNQFNLQLGGQAAGFATSTVLEGFPIRVGEIGPAPGPSAAAPPTNAGAPRQRLDPTRARRALAAMAPIEGLLGYAVVDSATGMVLARETREDPGVNMEQAAASSAQILRTHRLAARDMGLPGPIDEIITSAGARQQIMRSLTHYPDLFLIALLDRQHANLALARFQLIELERTMG